MQLADRACKRYHHLIAVAAPGQLHISRARIPNRAHRHKVQVAAVVVAVVEQRQVLDVGRVHSSRGARRARRALWPLVAW